MGRCICTNGISNFAFFRLTVAVIALSLWMSPDEAQAAQVGRRFTVADDVRLTLFEDADESASNAIRFSPNGQYFLVKAERGLLDKNRPESIIRLYRTEAVRRHILNQPNPVRLSETWEFRKSTYKDGPIISHVRWLADSSGFAFIAKTTNGNGQLFVAEINKHKLFPLTPERQDVTAFSICDRKHLVYTATSPSVLRKAIAEDRATSFAGTGRFLYELLSPGGLHAFWSQMLLQVPGRLNELWAITDSTPFQLMDLSGRPFPVYDSGKTALSLSPDGKYLVTVLPVRNIPPEWERQYPSPSPTFPYRIRAGSQDLAASDGLWDVSQYVLINLSSHKIQLLANAPTGWTAGWFAGRENAYWSHDGRFIALENTFLPANGKPTPPCVAVVDRGKKNVSCVQFFKAPHTSDYNPGYSIGAIHFAPGSAPRLTIDYSSQGFSWDRNESSATYQLSDSGSWIVIEVPQNERATSHRLNVSVQQSLNDPPALVATEPKIGISGRIWDPNPELTNITLGHASVYRWNDQTGREWAGVLYEPPDSDSHHRYPLVIQTHGFDESTFEPSGRYHTAFAARELAGAGIVVLQMRPCAHFLSPEEGPCNVTGFQSAVTSLGNIGLIDPKRVGLVGFSRTCFHVLEALTTGSQHFAAASITDGVNEGYLEFMMFVDFRENALAHEAQSVIGAPPFASGLLQWLRASPDFNMDKVASPLMVVAAGRTGVLGMWEPYAALRYLNKPVDFIVLNTDEHLLTNPGERMASQGGTVDWFRFWLQGYEDPDPAKAEQYIRWRELRHMQEAPSKRPEGM